MSNSAKSNRLALEKSPYLLQHARNPVDWYPWGDEAFARARAEDKPVFLSIGYSTCHWCHVMERESFEDGTVAELMNAHFVCIKVDREERPDVDRLYMTALNAMGLGGGWPLNAVLTPAGLPFWGGTYFPPTSRRGMIGMLELLPRLHGAWLDQRAAIEEGGARVLEALRSLGAPQGEAQPFAALADEAQAGLARAHDAAHGGFGGTPKFPSPGNLNFLARRAARDPVRNAEALAMLRGQLDAMRSGGIHDQIGGGFHRYATDAEWMVPHFEKMLYDQALLACAYLDGYQLTGEATYARTARGIFTYVLRDLLAGGGAFFSAEDADAEGEEGRFHVWTLAQVREALDERDAALFAHAYGVTPQGNFEHGTTVLHAAHTLEQSAAACGMSVDEAHARLTAASATLLALRETRTRPHRDDKILTAWNGLMIGALARGARVLRESALAEAATRAATFVWTHLRTSDGALLRRWCDGEAALPGQLDDHAYFVRGLIELFEATHDAVWLERALELTGAQVALFWDEQQGAFFESPAGDALVAVRMKDGFDGAELAGNSVAAENLARLAALTGRADWQALLERTLDYHARRLVGTPWAMPHMFVAMDLASQPGRQVVIAGEKSSARDALIAVYEARYRPCDTLVVVDAAARAHLARFEYFDFLPAPSAPIATAHVCVDRACRLPVNEPEALAAQLDEPASHAAGGELR